MKKKIFFFFKIVVAFIVLILSASICSFWYVNKTFISFEDGYENRTDIPELTINGYTFLDRNSKTTCHTSCFPKTCSDGKEGTGRCF